MGLRIQISLVTVPESDPDPKMGRFKDEGGGAEWLTDPKGTGLRPAPKKSAQVRVRQAGTGDFFPPGQLGHLFFVFQNWKKKKSPNICPQVCEAFTDGLSFPLFCSCLDEWWGEMSRVESGI